ncbi:hypothetical protein [Microcystis aeruginosa]|uniref:hypothetical protein n=1 Tax=Microcystis aeruginosa TaxID=1126 RepID=UPI0012DAF5A9|nr:hypothetical protein [Microcystis aeruginosa]BCU10910.1 hypothetical protein MAN88_14740 [Microcystis aeruginosa]
MTRWLHWPDTMDLFNPDGTFIYCAFSNAQLATFRPADTVNGTFVYCTFNLSNSGFDRTP